MTSPDNTASGASAPWLSQSWRAALRPPPDPEAVAAVLDRLDIPGWARDYITRGDDPHDVLDTWESDLATRRDRAAAYSGPSRDDIIRQCEAAGERLGLARKRLAELEAEREAARLAREQAQAAERAEQEAEAARQHAAWEAGAAERDRRARVLAEQQRREAAELRRLQLAGLAPLPATWWGHLMWLHRTFGDRSFTAAQVCEAGHDDPDRVMPPGFRTDLLAPDYPRYLGMAYAATARVDHDGTWIARAYRSRGVARWYVVIKWDAQLANGGPTTPAAEG